MKIKINSHIEKKLILLQRNELQNFYQRKIRKLFGRYLFTNFFIFFFNSSKNISKNASKILLNEFEDMAPHLPKSPNNILDIGSGLGMINLFLNNYYKKLIKFTLIDKNFVSKKIKYGFSSNYESYSLLNETKLFLVNNGLKNEQINLINADDAYNLNIKFDLIISLISMGYHYPLNNYLKILRNCSHLETVFIFDIAEEYNNIAKIKNIFSEVEILRIINKKHKQIRLICKKIKN